jgi:outer membrane scaffolding protein for murein synthesis (MipA/OmpV family)
MTTRSTLRRGALLCLTALLLAPAPALAQDGTEEPVQDAPPELGQDEEIQEPQGWTIAIGGGLQIDPKYPGADSYRLNPWVTGSIRRFGTPLPFEAPDDGHGFVLLPRTSKINFGPDVRFVNERDEDDVGAAVGRVGLTVEAGAFVEAYPLDFFRLRAAGRLGIGGHKGLVGDLAADFIIRDRDTHIFSIGPRLRWGDNTFHDAYFGITPTIAANTGLPAFNPDGDFFAIGVMAGYTQMLSRHWGLQAFAGYDRLRGDAADSPIVRNFGSRDQFRAGAAIFYTFNIVL